MDLLHHYFDDDDDTGEPDVNYNSNRFCDTTSPKVSTNNIMIGISCSSAVTTTTTTTTTTSTAHPNRRDTVDASKTSQAPPPPPKKKRKRGSSSHPSTATATTTTTPTISNRLPNSSRRSRSHNDPVVDDSNSHARIQIVTETEFAQLNHRNTNNPNNTATNKNSNNAITTTTIAGRWSTHCSCRVTFHPTRKKKRRNHHSSNSSTVWNTTMANDSICQQYIQSTCHTIQQRYPNYRGYCILLFDPTIPTTNSTANNEEKQNDQPSPPPQHFHISLTRPDVSLHTNHIDSFLTALTHEIQCVSMIRPFTIQFQPLPPQRLDVLHNPTKTKSFGVWRVKCGIAAGGGTNSHRQLQALSNCCNQVLTQRYEQRSYQYDTTNSDDDENNDNVVTTLQSSKQQQQQQQDPIYHISLVRFEPCLHEYMKQSCNQNKNNDSTLGCVAPEKESPTTTTTTTTAPTRSSSSSSGGNDDGSRSHGWNDDGDTYDAATKNAGTHDDFDDNDISESCDDDDDDDDDVGDSCARVDTDTDDTDDESISTGVHYIDRVTCSFGGGAKVYHIPLLK